MQAFASRMVKRVTSKQRLAGSGRRMMSAAAAISETNLKRIDWAVTLLGTAGVAWGCAELYSLYTDFPEGCQAIMEHCNRTPELLEIFGGHLSRPSGIKHIWEGRVESERLNVTIPVEGPSAEGELRCAAIKDSDGAWVVLVLEAHITRTSLHPTQLLKLQAGSGSDLEQGALPGAKGGSGAADNAAAAVEGGATPVLVFDVMHRQWLNTTYVIGAETEFAKGEAQTAAKVVVVPPSAASDPPPDKAVVPATDSAPHSQGSSMDPKTPPDDAPSASS